MFEKVLIAEDHESSNISVRKALEEFGVRNSDYVYYCDDALARVSAAERKNEPYDLLITDLSFEEDHNPQKISNGTDLIKAIRSIHPHIKVLVFSAEGKPVLIEQLFKELSIDAYVRKARRDVTELKLALEALGKNRRYLSTGVRESMKHNNSYEFKEYDILLVQLLSNGMRQKDIPAYLQQHQIKPAGLSSIEKRLNGMKEALNFTKNEQLVAFCKDMGVI
jgi:DNA-binding NarL/FixJ family response regulator